MSYQAQARKPFDYASLARSICAVFIIGLLLLAFGYGFYFISQPAKFPVRNVNISGDLSHLDRANLQQRVQQKLTKSFLMLDVKDIQNAVESLPWVQAAEVTRTWPDTLNVMITEEQATARWVDIDNKGAQVALVNPFGRLFFPNEKTIKNSRLPTLIGPMDELDTVFMRFQSITSQLSEADLEMSVLQLDEHKSWWLILTNGLELVIGKREPEHRLARFIDHYQKSLMSQSDKILSVDLRYANGFAVRWKP